MKLKEAFFSLSFVKILVEETVETAKTKFGQVPLWLSIGVLDMPLLLFHLYNLTETCLPI